MTPRFQADADFNQNIILGIRRKEPAVDFWDASRGGVLRVSDSEVLRISAEWGRILVSHDRKTMPSHFARFLERHSSPGVIIVSQSLNISSAIEDLLVIWTALNAQEWRDQIGYLPL